MCNVCKSCSNISWDVLDRPGNVVEAFSVQHTGHASQQWCLSVFKQVSFSPSFPGSGKGFAPQQVFISLKSRVSGALVLVAAKAAQSSPGDYVATVGPSTIAKQIGTQVTPPLVVLFLHHCSVFALTDRTTHAHKESTICCFSYKEMR